MSDALSYSLLQVRQWERKILCGIGLHTWRHCNILVAPFVWRGPRFRGGREKKMLFYFANLKSQVTRRTASQSQTSHWERLVCCSWCVCKLGEIICHLPYQITPATALLRLENHASLCLFVYAGLRLNNAWASGTVLRPFLQPESPLSSQSLVSGSKCKLRDSNSRPPYSRPRALTTRLYTIHHSVWK